MNPPNFSLAFFPKSLYSFLVSMSRKTPDEVVPQRPLLQILLIEDNPDDQKLIQEMFAEVKPIDYQLDTVDRVSAGLARLKEKRFDAIVADLSLPDCWGLEVLLKLQAAAPSLPIIIISGLFEEEALAVQAVEQGAQDYLVKESLDAGLLSRAIRYGLARKQAEEREKNLRRGQEGPSQEQPS